jgi:D-alanyl-D-alanine carboxypeptidase
MTAPARALMINGLRCALVAWLDARGRPCAGEFRRKRDHVVLARWRAGDGTTVRWRGERRHALPAALREERDSLVRALLAGPQRSVPPAASAAARRRQTQALLRQLAIDPATRAGYRPPPCEEPARLALAGRDHGSRELWLREDAAHAWRAMRAAAHADGVELLAVSGFRSAEYQAGLVARKLARGQPLSTILKVSALPGHSEHHLGTTLDLHGGDGPALESGFEATAAFAWLQAHAARFGFAMSYPRDNPWGIAYEPWHWRYRRAGRP